MAIDSQAKRQSTLFFGLPVYPQTLAPDGSIADGDLQDILWCYNGIEVQTITETYTTLSVETVSITDYDITTSVTDYDVTPTITNYGVTITEKNRLS